MLSEDDVENLIFNAEDSIEDHIHARDSINAELNALWIERNVLRNERDTLATALTKAQDRIAEQNKRIASLELGRRAGISMPWIEGNMYRCRYVTICRSDTTEPVPLDPQPQTCDEFVYEQRERIAELESDLRANATCLAQQTDAARNAEIRVMELESCIEVHNQRMATLEAVAEAAKAFMAARSSPDLSEYIETDRKFALALDALPKGDPK